jgi:hypothetical protein
VFQMEAPRSISAHGAEQPAASRSAPPIDHHLEALLSVPTTWILSPVRIEGETPRRVLSPLLAVLRFPETGRLKRKAAE